MVAPLLHRLPVADDEVNVTAFPLQTSKPEAVMVGVLGKEVTVTAVTVEAVELQPLATDCTE